MSMGSEIAAEDGRARAVLLFGDEYVVAAGAAGEGRHRDVARDRLPKRCSVWRRESVLAQLRSGNEVITRRERFLYPDTQPIGYMSSAALTIDHLLGEIASLPPEDQVLLHEVVGHRLIEARRREIADEAAAARESLERGKVRRGTTADLFVDLAVVAEPIDSRGAC